VKVVVPLIVIVIAVGGALLDDSEGSGTASGSGSLAWAEDGAAMSRDIQETSTEMASLAMSGDLEATERACGNAVGKVSDWREVATRIPIPSVQVPLMQALREYRLGFALCADGSYEAATSYLSKGNAHIREATAALDVAT
jgi:hypothetical protein